MIRREGSEIERERDRGAIAYRLTCVLSASILQLSTIHADLIGRQITSFHFTDVIGIHVACLSCLLFLDWVWECVILECECLWVEQINL